MFDSSSIVVGLEIGTSKVCAVVGELGAEGSLNIVGVGQCRSRGVRKGEIVDPSQAEDDVRHAIVEAEAMADVEIRSVYLGVTGAHLHSFTNRGMHPVVSADREITAEDVADAVKNARAINLPGENCIVHAVRQNFTVDGQAGVREPVGMLGARLEVDVHVIHGNFNRLQNPARVVRGLQLEVDGVVFNGLAASLAVLSAEQKELGALVIDLGGGTTDYVLYADGVIRHSGVLAVGGDHVSNDVSHGLKVTLSRAEQLKIDHGSAVPQDEESESDLVIPGGIGMPDRVLPRRHLHRVMSMRVEETLQLVAEDIHESGLADQIRTGVFLCGGGSRIPHLTELATQIFEMPVYLGHAQALSGLRSALDQPEFASAIGLVKFASIQQRRRSGGSWGKNLISPFTQLFR